jgi:hypothetical protein
MSGRLGDARVDLPLAEAQAARERRSRRISATATVGRRRAARRARAASSIRWSTG